MSTTPRRTPRILPKEEAMHSDLAFKCVVQLGQKLECRIDDLIDQRAALLAAGEKMHMALLQYHVRAHVIHEWQAVTHAIKEESQ